MPQPASNDVWDTSKPWTTDNRSLRTPTLKDIEPCARLRQELRDAKREIARLQAQLDGPAAHANAKVTSV